MWLIILLGFFQFNSSSADQVVKQSKSQAIFYLSQIEKEEDVDRYLWALTLLATENKKIQSFVEQRSASGTFHSPLIPLFSDIEESTAQQLKKVVFQTGSADLLVALLLYEDVESRQALYHQFRTRFPFPKGPVNYRALYNAILNQQKVTESILPIKSFNLPHFLLLTDQKWKNFFSDTYLRSIVNLWEKNISYKSGNSLYLPTITYIHVLYQLYDYANITTLSRSLSTDLFPNSSLKLRTYRYIDYSIYRTGRYDLNLNIVRHTLLPLAQYLNEQQAVLNIKKLLGVYLYSIGKLNQAKKIYTEVLEQATRNDISINRSSLYNNLGITYLKLGEYDKYLDLQFQALETAQKKNNYSHQLEIYINLFVYYQQKKDLQNALAYLDKARQAAEQIEDNSSLGKVYTFLGLFYRKFKQNYTKAHQYYERAQKVLDPENDSMNFIYLLNEQAETYEQQKKFKQALAKHNRIIELTQQKNSPTYIDALVNKALVNLKMGRISRAKALIDTFSTMNLNQLDFEQVVKANTVKANYLDRTGATSRALDILKPTIDQVVERARNSTDIQSGFWHIADEYLNAFDLLVSIYIQNEQPGKAVALLDRLKTINDASIYQNPLLKARALSESELTQYKNITGQLDRQRKKLLTASPQHTFAIQQRINELELRKRVLDRKLITRKESSPLSIRAIQSRLSGHQLILHITELKNQYYIAKISRTGISVKSVPFTEKSRRLFSNAVQQIARHDTNLDSLYAVSKFLGIPEIPDYITDVTVIPDSYLYQLPIDVLPLRPPAHSYSYGSTRYFIEQYTTHYLTSLDDFNNQMQDRTNSSYRWDFVGYGVSTFDQQSNPKLVPLPFAKTEVLKIQDQLTHLSDLKVYINDSVRKKTFMQTASKARILHLATHSEVSEQAPLFSTIYMSGASDSADSSFTDQLFAYELFDLNLNNEMIMLNSCKSGSGSYIKGTGILGFSRALQYAGANSLILNIWSVNDMFASDFAVYFYEQLNKGKSKAEALQDTKRYFLATKNASPHFWGPYMLIGNTQPIVHPDRSRNIAVAGSFIGYFLLLVILSVLKERGILFRTR